MRFNVGWNGDVLKQKRRRVRFHRPARRDKERGVNDEPKLEITNPVLPLYVEQRTGGAGPSVPIDKC
jgi:hypothetical protein